MIFEPYKARSTFSKIVQYGVTLQQNFIDWINDGLDLYKDWSIPLGW